MKRWPTSCERRGGRAGRSRRRSSIFRTRETDSPSPPGGDILAYCNRVGVIHVVDPVDGSVLDRIDSVRHGVEGLCCLAVSPKGEFVAVGSTGGQVLVWDRKNGRLHAVWQADPSTVRALAFTEDGKSLVSSGSTPSALLWSLADVRGKGVKR